MRTRNRKTTLGKVIATRVVTEIGDALRELTISLGAPRPHPDGDWECPFLIQGVGKPRIETAGGIDALQALILAIGGIRITLEQRGNSFRWLGEAGTGIPQSVPTTYGAGFEQRIARLIEREAARYWERKLRNREGDIAACEAELKQRKASIAAWETVLKKRKNRAAEWRASLESDRLHKQKSQATRKSRQSR